MQIHELPTFTGTPSASDYLAIDSGTTTSKVAGVDMVNPDELTVAEANTGTSTASRIVTPKVVHDYVTGEIDDITSSATESKWSAITGGDGSINDSLSHLGDVFGEQIKTASDSVSVSTSAVNVVSIILPPGIWIAVCECAFGTSTSGRRFVGFSDTSAVATENRVQTSPVSGGSTIAQSIGIAVNSTNSNKTFYLVAACSGISSAITATGSITAVRIK